MVNNGFLDVSVIVPSFNNEKYLYECILSIIKNRPAEIIIIDDCSNDRSYEVAKQIASEFKNVRVLKTEVNSGAAAARKIGFLNATKEIVGWVDSDDILEQGAIRNAFELMTEDVDLCIWELWRLSENGNIYKNSANPTNLPLTGEEAVLLSLGGWRIHAAGLVRKDLMLKSYKELEIESFNNDELITRLLLRNSRKIVGSTKKYFYRVNYSSTTMAVSDRHLTGLRSDIWLIDFSLKIKNSPVKKIIIDSVTRAWFFFNKRHLYTRRKLHDELGFYLDAIIFDKRKIKYLCFSPKYLVALFVLFCFNKISN